MMINIKLVDILEVGREYTKNLPLGLSIAFLFTYEIISIVNMQGASDAASSSQTINNVSLQILHYPLEILTIFNKLFMFVTSPSDYTVLSNINDFISIINTIVL